MSEPTPLCVVSIDPGYTKDDLGIAVLHYPLHIPGRALGDGGWARGANLDSAISLEEAGFIPPTTPGLTRPMIAAALFHNSQEGYPAPVPLYLMDLKSIKPADTPHGVITTEDVVDIAEEYAQMYFIRGFGAGKIVVDWGGPGHGVFDELYKRGRDVVGIQLRGPNEVPKFHRDRLGRTWWTVPRDHVIQTAQSFIERKRRGLRKGESMLRVAPGLTDFPTFEHQLKHFDFDRSAAAYRKRYGGDPPEILWRREGATDDGLVLATGDGLWWLRQVMTGYERAMHARWKFSLGGLGGYPRGATRETSGSFGTPTTR